jgi:ribosomal biogenesis protein LAS1
MVKIVVRDASLRTRFRQAIGATTRDIERWVAEAKVAADISSGDVGWATDGDTLRAPRTVDEDDHINSKERWALERLCDVLLEKGGLVPLSRKYVA